MSTKRNIGRNRSNKTPSPGLWYMKDFKSDSKSNPKIAPPFDLSNSMAEFLEKEKMCQGETVEITDTDISSLIQEINRLAAESPGLKADIDQIGGGNRTIEDIIREAEKLSETSSKAFEQLSSSRSTSSLRSRSTPRSPRSTKSTPRTPKSQEIITQKSSSKDEYDDTFNDSVSKSTSENVELKPVEEKLDLNRMFVMTNDSTDTTDEKIDLPETDVKNSQNVDNINEIVSVSVDKSEIDILREEVQQKNILLNEYEKDNRRLREEIKTTKEELEVTKTKLSSESLRSTSKSKLPIDKSLQSELDRALENLKDLQEHNTALQLQLDSLNNSHQVLKQCNEELSTTNKTLERKLIENEALINRLKNELKTLQDKHAILIESERALKKTIENEKQQNKILKQQNDKDSKCIQDLQRQVKEMERIITRKHPDSVSALILAANSTNIDSNLNARKILEDRIKQLEQEAQERDVHQTKIFTDVQEKFNEMKRKYESHIDDLEKHVLDLKSQLNKNIEFCDMETQTYLDTNSNRKEVHFVEVAVQTLMNKIPQLANKNTKYRSTGSIIKEDTHLLATIRGLNADILAKDRLLTKLQKDMEELRKTNRRLQKEREGSLKANYNPTEYQFDNLTTNQQDLDNLNIQMDTVRDEREKLKIQLSRLEEDYQLLKLKRLQDLNTLQEAHEQELTNYMGKMAPLREQLEVQQVTIKKLQQQLSTAREQIAVLTVERDHLEQRLKTLRHSSSSSSNSPHDNIEFDVNNSAASGLITTRSEYDVLRRKIALLEQRYEERELRLRAIVQGLAQKQQSAQSARDCEQCQIRQQQLCSYKAELDQVLSTLRNHTNL